MSKYCASKKNSSQEMNEWQTDRNILASSLVWCYSQIFLWNNCRTKIYVTLLSWEIPKLKLSNYIGSARVKSSGLLTFMILHHIRLHGAHSHPYFNGWDVPKVNQINWTVLFSSVRMPLLPTGWGLMHHWLEQIHRLIDLNRINLT